MLIRKLKTLFKIIICGLRTINGTQNAKFLNAEDTIKVICKEHKSLIRLGDGEINILRGKSVSYQPWSPELQEGIEKTIERYLENKAKYILGMPGEFLSPKSYELKWRHLKSWAFSRDYFNKHFDRDITYGDAFVFARPNVKIYERIWLDGNISKIIFIHNNERYAQEFEKKYKIRTQFIRIPEIDAFKHIHDIEDEIENAYDENAIVLLSAGPASKVIVRELSEKGLWCIDTGHCWDSPLLLR